MIVSIETKENFCRTKRAGNLYFRSMGVVSDRESLQRRWFGGVRSDRFHGFERPGAALTTLRAAAYWKLLPNEAGGEFS